MNKLSTTHSNIENKIFISAYNWYEKWKGYKYNIFFFFTCLIIGVCIESGLTCKLSNLWAGISGIVFTTIFIFLAFWDLIAWCISYIFKQLEIEEWETSNILQNIPNVPLNKYQIADKELELFAGTRYELKIIVIRLFCKFLCTTITIIIAFGILHSLVAKIFPSYILQAYNQISNESSIFNFIYLSIIIFTNTGIGNILPNYNPNFPLPFIITAFEILSSYIYTILFLILLISCVYSAFSMRPAYFSAYLRAIRKQK